MERSETLMFRELSVAVLDRNGYPSTIREHALVRLDSRGVSVVQTLMPVAYTEIATSRMNEYHAQAERDRALLASRPEPEWRRAIAALMMRIAKRMDTRSAQADRDTEPVLIRLAR
jgi:hypothetical protein